MYMLYVEGASVSVVRRGRSTPRANRLANPPTGTSLASMYHTSIMLLRAIHYVPGAVYNNVNFVDITNVVKIQYSTSTVVQY